MKLTVCFMLLACLVAVNTQKGSGGKGGRRKDCKYGKPTVSECDGEEFTISRPLVSGGDDCPEKKKTKKCMTNSEGNMVPVDKVVKKLECFYTLPDMTAACDAEAKTLTISQTLVSGDVEECEATIETTVDCSEKENGELVPNRAEMRRNRRPNKADKPDGAPRRRGPRGGKNKNNPERQNGPGRRGGGKRQGGQGGRRGRGGRGGRGGQGKRNGGGNRIKTFPDRLTNDQAEKNSYNVFK